MKINYPEFSSQQFCTGSWVRLYGVFLQQIHRADAWTPAQLAAMRVKVHKVTSCFPASLVLAYILAHFVQYTKAASVAADYRRFWLWLGFIVQRSFPPLFLKSQTRSYFLNIGYQFVACLAAGEPSAIWKPHGPR